jgi:dimethylhistidine N-methyltransferase
MQLEEYYLPKSEMEIIHQHSDQIAKDIASKIKKLQIVELGAGDGTKTRYFLKHFLPNFNELEYVAMDISDNILEVNKVEVQKEIPQIIQRNIAGNYFETYQNLEFSEAVRLVLFLGANIGNFPNEEAFKFFNFVKSKLKPSDYFLVAFDLVKNPRKIIAAYDDKQGITKQFNLNLLNRINKEMEADFDVSKFDHFPFYNPLTGITSSQIISLEVQKVSFKDGFVVEFDAFEAIHTEVSKKFFWSDIEEVALNSGFKIVKSYYDSKKEYAFVLFQPDE